MEFKKLINRYWIKVYQDKVVATVIICRLSKSARGVYLYMLFANNKGCIYVDQQQISSALDVSQASVSLAMNELEEHKLIFKINGGYKLNPRYAKVG